MKLQNIQRREITGLGFIKRSFSCVFLKTFVFGASFGISEFLSNEGLKSCPYFDNIE